MPDYPIDLGKEPGKLENPVNATTSSPETPRKYYPSLYLEWETDYGFPESGEMTVKFNRKSATVKKKPDGKTSYSVDLDITSIEDVEPDKESKPKKSVGDILDMLRAEVESEKGEY